MEAARIPTDMATFINAWDFVFIAKALIALDALLSNLSNPLRIPDKSSNGPASVSKASPIFLTNKIKLPPRPIVRISPMPIWSLNFCFMDFAKLKIFSFKPSRSSPTDAKCFLTSSLNSLIAFLMSSNFPSTSRK